ncbi:MAG: PIN domain-containing protein [Geobacteraceae bacterium]|nr:PIN domain-containing protein [Geobacteraceae bacterium]
MKRAVFVDTDIILDLLTRREPFYPAAAQLFSLVERGEQKACVSALTFANLFYILRKELSAPKAVDVLKKLRQLVTVLPVDDRIVALALDGGFTDFEDALQYQTALSKGIACLITRNTKDYRKPVITVCTAEEFLARRASS